MHMSTAPNLNAAYPKPQYLTATVNDNGPILGNNNSLPFIFVELLYLQEVLNHFV